MPQRHSIQKVLQPLTYLKRGYRFNPEVPDFSSVLFLLVERVLPLQLRKSSEISISALKRQPMFNSERSEMGIWNKIRHCLCILEQVTQNASMAIGRQWNPHRWKCEPLQYLRPGISDAEWAIKGFGIGPDPNKCQKGGPRQSYLLPTIQLIFQPTTCLLMVWIIFDCCVK